jgi:hypothetical protein
MVIFSSHDMERLPREYKTEVFSLFGSLYIFSMVTLVKIFAVKINTAHFRQGFHETLIGIKEILFISSYAVAKS